MKRSILVCVLMLFKFSVQAQNVDCHPETRIEFSFLNGIDTKESEAKKAADRIGEILRKDKNYLKAQVPKLDQVCATYLYNQTYGLMDFVEVFIQKLKETQGDKINLTDVAMFFFMKEVLFLTKPDLFNANEKIGLMIQMANLAQAHEESTMKLITEQAVKPLNRGSSLLVISHSQGNMFANRLYESLQRSGANLDKYGNLQIATIANDIIAPKNDYITLAEDLVVNATRAYFPVLLPTHVVKELTINKDFYLSHNFINVYTSPSLLSLDGFLPMTMEKIFFKTLSEVAEKIVDHKCTEEEGPEAITYPADGGGYISKRVETEGIIKIAEGAIVCGDSSLLAGTGQINITGAGSRLVDVEVTNENLQNIRLNNVNLKDALLKASTYGGLSLSNVVANGVSIINSDIVNSSLSGVNAENSRIFDSTLSQVDAQGSNISSSTLTGVSAEGSHIESSSLEGVSDVGSDIWRSTLKGASTDNTEIFDSTLSGVTVKRSNLKRTEVDNSTVESSSFDYSTILSSESFASYVDSSIIESSILENTRVGDSSVNTANLNNSYVFYSNLSNVTFSNAVSTNSSVSNSRLASSNATECSLSNKLLENESCSFGQIYPNVSAPMN